MARPQGRCSSDKKLLFKGLKTSMRQPCKAECSKGNVGEHCREEETK